MSEPTDINSNIINSNEDKITVKKSTYNNLLRGIVAAIAIATFFGCYSVGNFDISN